MYSVRITELEKELKNGRKIFSGLNLELEESSLTALVGASGEGKTTLLNVIGLAESANWLYPARALVDQKYEC